MILDLETIGGSSWLLYILISLFVFSTNLQDEVVYGILKFLNCISSSWEFGRHFVFFSKCRSICLNDFIIWKRIESLAKGNCKVNICLNFLEKISGIFY